MSWFTSSVKNNAGHVTARIEENKTTGDRLIKDNAGKVLVRTEETKTATIVKDNAGKVISRITK